MTIDQFLIKLSAHCKPLKLVVEDDMPLRIHDKKFYYCPLTFVAQRECGRYFRPSQFYQAAEALDLEIPAITVVSSADCPRLETPEFIELRKRLITAMSGELPNL